MRELVLGHEVLPLTHLQNEILGDLILAGLFGVWISAWDLLLPDDFLINGTLWFALAAYTVRKKRRVAEIAGDVASAGLLLAEKIYAIGVFVLLATVWILLAFGDLR